MKYLPWILIYAFLVKSWRMQIFKNFFRSLSGWKWRFCYEKSWNIFLRTCTWNLFINLLKPVFWKKFGLVTMVSKPYPIQSKANPSKKSNPIFITQQNLHAIQMAFLNENFYLDWNPTQLCWALIGSVQSMDFFQSSPLCWRKLWFWQDFLYNLEQIHTIPLIDVYKICRRH